MTSENESERKGSIFRENEEARKVNRANGTSERACANESGQIEKLLESRWQPRKRNRARDFSTFKRFVMRLIGPPRATSLQLPYLYTTCRVSLFVGETTREVINILLIAPYSEI